MSSAPRIFISYSRVNRDFAEDLRNQLIEAGFEVWRDLHDMEPGRNWWQQIQEAIEESETMVLCMSVEALESRVVGDEWRYARQVGTRVIPVVADEVFKQEDVLSGKVTVPRWMQKVDWLDIRQIAPEANLNWKRLLNTLKTPFYAPRVPFTVPPDLYDPKRFVDRPTEYEPLKAALLDNETRDPVAITTAIYGGGGFGKTTLAAALCYDDDILSAFDDGILWVTLGQSPDLPALMSEMYYALTNEQVGFRSTTEAGPRLAEQLKSRDCLLILDDAWLYDHVRPLLSLSERSAVLITTRQFGIAAEASAKPIDVNEMATDEAVQMLTAALETPPEDLSPFHELAKRLGEWPLLLEIAAGMLRKRFVRSPDITKALDWLNRKLEKRGVTGIVRESEEARRQGAAGTLSVSMELLEDADLRRYQSLAIFPEDEAIPLATLGQLWDLDEFDTEEQVERLADLALLRWDNQVNTIRLHDVIREYLETQLEDAPATHARLLETWGDGWAMLPDDYAWDHYAYHLHGANRDDELTALFTDQQWMNARFDYDGYTYTGYIADLMLVWEHVAHEQAITQLENGQDVTALADCVRYALIRTSINSLAGNYVPAIVTRAVTTGVWESTRALNIAHNVSDAQKRAEMYMALLGTGQLSEQERWHAEQQALAAAKAIRDGGSRALMLSALVDKLNKEQRTVVLNEVLTAIRAIPQLEYRARTLNALADKLETEQVSKALRITQELQDNRYRALVFSVLADKLDEVQRAEVLRKALVAAQAIKDEHSRVIMLGALADKLDQRLREVVLNEALNNVLPIYDDYYRAHALSTLIDKLDAEQVGEVLAAALTNHNKRYRPLLLSALAKKLDKAQASEVLVFAKDIQDKSSRVEVLIALADKVNEDKRAVVLNDALATAQGIPDERSRAEVLIALVDMLDQKQRAVALNEALATAQDIKSVKSRAEVLITLADMLDVKQRAVVLNDALATAQGIPDKRSRAKVLIALVDMLDQKQRAIITNIALATAQDIQDEGARAEVLIALTDKLHEGEVSKALATTLAIQNKYSRADVLSAMAGKLNKVQVSKVLTAIQAIPDEGSRAEALIALANMLDQKQREAVLNDALTTAQNIQAENYRAKVLIALADMLNEKQRAAVLNDSLATAQGIQDERSRGKVLIALVDKLDEKQNAYMLNDALATAWEIQNEAARANALIVFVNKLEEKQGAVVLSEALTAARGIWPVSYRVEVLIGITAKLEAKQQTVVVSDALATAQSFEDEYSRARALSDLVDKLEGKQRALVLNDALTAAQGIQDEWYRARVLNDLVDKLEGTQRALVLNDALAAAQAIQDEGYRASVLSSLADKLDPDPRSQVVDEALAATQAIQNEDYRASILRSLFNKLDPAQVGDALAATQGIQKEWARASVFSALADQIEEKQRPGFLLKSLQEFQHTPRSVVLLFCEQPAWFPPEFISADTVFQVAQHIEEICNEWVWS